MARGELQVWARLTDFGFTWGPAEVRRLFSDAGHVTFEVRTKRGCARIRVTPSGLIRISRPGRRPTPSPAGGRGER